jgi:hypothetical protein
MLALMLLVAVQAALRLDVSTANDASNAKNRPVTKVVNLIKDMQEQLQKEAEEDQEVYEKLACWCETNDKEKTASIEEAESRITALTSSIEEGTAMSSRLNTEIKNLEKEIARNQESLDKATAMRQKELAEFNAEEKDVLQSIGALKSAIIALSKHHEFIQVPSETLINIAAMVQWQFHKHADMLQDIVTPHQRKAVSAFIQAPGDYFDAEPTFKQSYAPQSGAIFGILKQMKETFETNLSNSQKEEMTAQAAYQDLKAAKEEEIKSGEEQRDTKTQELADTDEKLAQDKQDLDDTRNSLSADQKFLMNLKETCQNADGEFEERTKSRRGDQGVRRGSGHPDVGRRSRHLLEDVQLRPGEQHVGGEEDPRLGREGPPRGCEADPQPAPLGAREPCPPRRVHEGQGRYRRDDHGAPAGEEG